MAYSNRTTRSNKKSHDLDKHLRLQQKLSSDRQVVKIGDDSTGLLLKDKDVIIEGETTMVDDLTVGGAATISGTVKIGAATSIIGTASFYGGARIVGTEGGNASLVLMGDEGDDAGDEWQMLVNQSNQKLILGNDLASAGTYVSHLEITPHATVASSTVTLAGSLAVNASAGFTRVEETFSATGVIGSGGTDDTDIDFRFGNKHRLEMTGDITTMNLIFPASSGNFLLACTTDGDHDVTNWKVWESDESAATTTDVMWAGGSVPAFTSSGVDIVSFYWDATEQQAYGTASLAFATP